MCGLVQKLRESRLQQAAKWLPLRDKLHGRRGQSRNGSSVTLRDRFPRVAIKRLTKR